MFSGVICFTHMQFMQNSSKLFLMDPLAVPVIVQLTGESLHSLSSVYCRLGLAYTYPDTGTDKGMKGG